MSATPIHPAARPAGRDSSSEARVNKAFQTLLREAAEKREERQRVHSREDAAAAKQEILDLLVLRDREVRTK